jgi:hypothetical protein
VRRFLEALEHAWAFYRRENSAEIRSPVCCDTPYHNGQGYAALSGNPAVWAGLSKHAPTIAHVPILRWVAFILVASTFFAVALSDAVYELTSPLTLSWHVLLRKTYSIGAFALVGALLTWALPARTRRPLRIAAAIALYSALIEVGQRVSGSRESFTWNVIDVMCGAIGGYLGYVGARLRVLAGK